MAFSVEELAALAVLEDRCIMSIMRTDWCDEPLTVAERQIIGMAVSWTYARMKELAPELAELVMRGG